MGWFGDRVKDFFSDAAEVVDFNAEAEGVATGSASLGADVSSLANLATCWVAESVQKAALELSKDGKVVEEPDGVDLAVHTLLRRPYPLYTGKMLQYIIARDRLIHGTSFVRKIRNGTGLPMRLMHIPFSCVHLDFDSSGKLSGYEIISPTNNYTVMPDDMITFKNGVNPTHPYMGVGAFAYLGHAMFVDEEALKFSAAVFKNAIAGIVASLERDENTGLVAVSAADARAFNQRLTQAFGSTNKGAAMFFNSKLKLDRLEPAFSDMDLTGFHALCEERVCASAFVHPSVLGLGTGVRNTRIGATAREYRRESWENGVLPVLESITETLNSQLLTDFYGEDDSYTITFNVGHINSLRYSVDEVMAMVDRGVISAERALIELGLDDAERADPSAQAPKASPPSEGGAN